MNREKACRILEIEENASIDEIKKKYRQLIRKVHPDAKAFRQEENAQYAHSAQQLNEAYAYLCENQIEDGLQSQNPSKRKRNSSKATKEQNNWKAKENPFAYRARNIYYELRDEDGEKLGDICVAKGKYYWIEDEDFTMFLKSMFMLSKEILDEIDEEIGFSMETVKRMSVQAELSYLLSAQFLDGEYSLKHLNQSQEDGDFMTYHFDAMLETNGETMIGEALFPKRISKHKLYLQDEKGIEVGYLSFSDDRLYYVIIPLFEQRLVQVKMRLKAEKKAYSKRKKARSYKDVDLWIRFIEKDENRLRESLNTQIENLLQRYREEA